MNEEQLLKTLAQWARQEPVPRTNVSEQVLRRIKAAQRAVDVPMAIVAGMSAAAAVIIVVHATQAWLAWQDPFAEALSSMNVVLQ